MSLGKRAFNFESSMWDLIERVVDLRTFDRAFEVNAHFDDQATQLQITYESAINLLKKREEDLLAEMRSLREKALASDYANCDELESRRHKCILPAEMDDFISKATAALEAHKRELISTTQPSKLEQEVRQLIVEASKLHVRQITSAFSRKIPEFCMNPRRGMPQLTPGRTEYSRFESKKKPFDSLIGESLAVLHDPLPAPCVLAIYLSSDQLVLCSSKGHVAVLSRNINPAELSFDLNMKETEERVTAIIEIPSCQFVTAQSNEHGMKTFECGKPNSYPNFGWLVYNIISFQVLNNRELALLSKDDTITIIDLHDIQCRRVVIRGHGCTQINCQMGKLSNQWLVTCSNDSDNCMLRIWDPENRIIVMEKPAGLKQVCALAVLSDDRVAIASLDGSLKIISLVGDSSGKLLIGPKKQPNHINFIEVLVNDDIVISDSSLERPHLQVWDSVTGELMQSIDTEHTGPIISCHLCPKKEKLVTVSVDGTVRTWRVNNRTLALF